MEKIYILKSLKANLFFFEVFKESFFKSSQFYFFLKYLTNKFSILDQML